MGYCKSSCTHQLLIIKSLTFSKAGQERFRTLTSSYYRGAQGIILVYDVTNRDSFENLKNWLKEVNLYSTYPDAIKLLVGNKIDLSQKRQVSHEMGELFASQNGMLFIEASAKTRIGVEQAFDEVAHKILDNESLLSDTTPMRLSDNGNTVTNLDDTNEEEQGYCSYCGF